MRSNRYVHPEFGLLSPTPRLRRELRMAFFSVLLGIAIGAAAVIALSGKKTSDDAQVSGLSSAICLSVAILMITIGGYR
jgi:DMSO reductase anchor subunit